MIDTPLLGILNVPPGLLFGLPPAVIVLILLLWGIKEPLAWIVVSFLAIGIGIGCLVYGFSQAILLPDPWTAQAASDVSMYIGGGAGSSVGGIVLLIVSLVRRRKSPAPAVAVPSK